MSGELLTTRLRHLSFKAMLSQEIGWFDREENSVGQLTTSLNSAASEVQNLSGFTLGSIIELITGIIGVAVVALLYGWKLGLVVLATLPLVILAGKYRLDIIMKSNSLSKPYYDSAAESVCEAVSNMRTIASLSRERELLASYGKTILRPLQIGRRSALTGSIFLSICEAILFLTNALAFWYGIKLFLEDGYTVKQLFTCLMAAMFLGQASGKVFSLMPDTTRAFGYARELFGLLERKPKIPTYSRKGVKLQKTIGQGVTVEFEQVDFHYPTRPGTATLRGLNLVAHHGDFIGLVGASGCGKSTIVSLVERFYDINGGRLRIDGNDINSLNVESLRNVVGLIPQDPELFNMTIDENIRMGAKEYSSNDVAEAAKLANIHDFIMGLPEGYQTNVGAKGCELSGGQRQRISIARALLRNPSVLLMDESTSMLDNESEKMIQQSIERSAQHRTVIAVAHRLSTIKNASCIYVIGPGGVVLERGTHQELMNIHNGEYLKLAQEQDIH
jgi:ATP-binding cassette subfamily B (MDR/TAP) protein 1